MDTGVKYTEIKFLLHDIQLIIAFLLVFLPEIKFSLIYAENSNVIVGPATGAQWRAIRKKLKYYK